MTAALPAAFNAVSNIDGYQGRLTPPSQILQAADPPKPDTRHALFRAGPEQGVFIGASYPRKGGQYG